MSLTLAMSEPTHRPCPALSSPAPEPFEAHAIVHVVGFDEEVQGEMADLFQSVGLETRAHGNLHALAQADLTEAPGCILIRARSALTGVLDFLTAFLRNVSAPPMVVAAERADVRMAVLAMKAGAADFLEHPVRDHDLLEAVGRALRMDYARRRAEGPLKEWQARFQTLTPREREVMLLVAQGRLNKQVAWDLGLSEVTVKVHRGSAMRKMRARSLADLVRMADAVAIGSETAAQRPLELVPLLRG